MKEMEEKYYEVQSLGIRVAALAKFLQEKKQKPTLEELAHWNADLQIIIEQLKDLGAFVIDYWTLPREEV